MKHSEKLVLGVGLAAGATLLLVKAARAKEYVEILTNLYSLDGETWEGLDGAVLPAGQPVWGRLILNNPLDTPIPIIVEGKLTFEGTTIEQTIYEGDIVPGETIIDSEPVPAYAAGDYTAEITVLEGETMETLDSKTVNFNVYVPAPAGTILSIDYLNIDSQWVPLGDLTVLLDTMLNVGVEWRNDGDYDTLGHIDLTVTDPSANTELPVATGGQNTVVAPGGTARVTFDVLIDEQGGWLVKSDLSGEF